MRLIPFGFFSSQPGKHKYMSHAPQDERKSLRLRRPASPANGREQQISRIILALQRVQLPAPALPSHSALEPARRHRIFSKNLITTDEIASSQISGSNCDPSLLNRHKVRPCHSALHGYTGSQHMSNNERLKLESISTSDEVTTKSEEISSDIVKRLQLHCKWHALEKYYVDSRS